MPSLQPARDDDVFDLGIDELDRLPFGVVTLDRNGIILRYNLVEANLARIKRETIGFAFFVDVAPCANVQAFRGRFDEFALRRDSGVECFDFTFKFNWGRHDVSITMVRKADYEAINLLVRRPTPAVEFVRPVALCAEPQSSQPTSASWVALATPESVQLGSDGEARLRCSIHPQDAPDVIRHVQEAVARRIPYAVEYRRLGEDGATTIIQEVGVFDALARNGVAALVDVTAQRAAEREQWHAAHYDALTGLPNRRLLAQRIAETLESGTQGSALAAVLLVNIDRFRETNDLFGRTVGNQLLKMLGARFEQCVGDGGIVAHLGLDMFGVLLTGVASSTNVTAIAGVLLKAAAEPFLIDGRSYSLTVSIGISAAPADGRDSDTLLRYAYTAMGAAKSAGRNTSAWYRDEMTTDAAQHGRQSNALRAAIDNGEIELHYQPLVDIEHNRIVAVEALARWTHPLRGNVPPVEFIELADRTGLIVPLGDWVLREACRQAQEWNELGFDLRVCVNVSAVQFRQPNFVANVGATLDSTGLEPGRLEIELTETVMVDGIKEMMERLTRLKALGIRLAIDDFGTGYSSLAYLKYFPVDTLKIDRAFVTDIAADSFDRAIATTVFTLANALGLDCVVEGIEDEEQLATLSTIGCRIMQGFYFCKPLPPDALRALLGTSAAALLR